MQAGDQEGKVRLNLSTRKRRQRMTRKAFVWSLLSSFELHWKKDRESGIYKEFAIAMGVDGSAKEG